MNNRLLGFQEIFGPRAAGVGSHLVFWARRNVPASDVEDFCQDVLHRTLKHVDAHGPESVENARAFVLKVAENLRGEIRRSKHRWKKTQPKLVERQKQAERTHLDTAMKGRSLIALEAPLSQIAIVSRAIQNLTPRQQRFLRLDLVERLTPDEIYSRMNFRSKNYFTKYKSLAFKALREEILRQLG